MKEKIDNFLKDLKRIQMNSEKEKILFEIGLDLLEKEAKKDYANEAGERLSRF